MTIAEASEKFNISQDTLGNYRTFPDVNRNKAESGRMQKRWNASMNRQ